MTQSTKFNLEQRRSLKKSIVVPMAFSILLQMQMPAFAGHHGDVGFANRVRPERFENRHELRQMQRLQNANTAMVIPNVNRFDLRSARNIVSLTQYDLRGASSVSLMLGGLSQEFHAGDRVSAAEYLAIKGGGNNNLVLDARGRAQGGQLSLNSLTSDLQAFSVGKVFIPENVSALGNFSQNSTLNFGGDLVNRGSIYGFSANAANQTGALVAESIYNQRGGSITTIMPASLTQNVGATVSDFSLALNANKDIVNAGSITSSGRLTLQAGGSITNALSTGDVGAAPVIQAAQAVNLVAGSGIINNAGVISSLQSDINVSSLSAKTAIAINGTNGAFNAQNGNINIRDALALDAGDVSIVGGDYQSNNLNIFAYQGDVNGTVGKLTGNLNTFANSAQLFANTDVLTLGNNCITGDPTYVNSGGGIVIDGVNKFDQKVAIIANGDITAKNGAQIVNPGGDVILIAGAKATTTGAKTNSIPGSKATADVVVSLNPADGAGGNIDLSTGAATTVITTVGAKGGDVTLVALANSANNGGKVLLGTNSIDTSSNAGTGSLAGNDGGDVAIYAGRSPAANEDTITVGSITTGGAAMSKGGTITLATQQAVSTGANNSLTINPQGKITVGGIKGSGVTADKASILISGALSSVGSGGYRTDLSGRSGASAGAITIAAGSSVLAKNSILAYGSGGFGGSITNVGGNGGAIDISSKNGNVTVEGQINSSGGGGGGAGTPGAGGKSANITIAANKGTIGILGALYAVDGGSGGKVGGGGGSYGGGGGGDNDSGGGGGFFGGGGASLFNGGGGGNAGGAGGEAQGTQKAGKAGGPGAGGAGSADPGFTKGGYGGALGQGGGASQPVDGGPNQAENGQDANKSTAVVTLSAQDSIVTNDFLRGGVVKLTTTSNTNGQISVSKDVQGFTSIELTTNKGNIFAPSSAAFVSPTLSFKSSSGSFGTEIQSVNTNASNLSVDTGSGGGPVTVSLNNAGAVTISGVKVAGAGSFFGLSAATSMVTKGGKIVAENVGLSIVKSGSTVMNVDTEATNLNVSTSKTGSVDVTVKNTGELFLGDSFVDGNFSVSTTATATKSGIMHLVGNIDARLLSLTSSAAQGLTSGILMDNQAAFLSVGTLVLADTGVGSIGTKTNPLQAKASQLSFNTHGSVYLANVGSLNINKSQAGYGARVGGSDTVMITTTPDAEHKAGRIYIGNGSLGGITVNGPNGDKDSTLILQASNDPGGVGGIIWNAQNTDPLKAGNVILTSGVDGKSTWGIGISNDNKPIYTQAGTLSVNTGANAFISNTGNVAVGESALSDNSSTYVLLSSGAITGSTGKVTALNVILNSSTTIGASNVPVLVNATNITAKAINGSVFIEDQSSNPVNLKIQDFKGLTYENKAKNTYSISAPNSPILSNLEEILEPENIVLSSTNVTNNFALKATNSINITATTGNVSINKAITAPNISLSALTDTKTIVQQKDGIINATLLTLAVADRGVANLKDFDNKVSGLATKVTGEGQILLRTVNDLKLGAISGDKQQLTVLYTGNLTTDTTGTINVGPLTLTPTTVKADNSITILKPINAGSPAALTATGLGTITIKGAVTGSGNLDITTAKGKIDLQAGISANQVTLTTNGADISQTAAGVVTAKGVLIVNLKNAGTANLSTAANDFVVFRDNIVGAGVVKLNSTKTLVLDDVKGVSQKFTATSDDTIVTPSVIEAQQLNLTAKGAGGIASSGDRVKTAATDLTLNATNAVGNVFASYIGTGSVSLKASSAGSNFDLESNDGITVDGALSANNIKLTSGKTVATGGIAIKANTGKSTSLVNLTALGTGNLTTNSAVVEGTQVDLTSSGGNIGGGDFSVKAANLSANTSGNGVVSIASQVTSQLNLNTSSSGKSFTLTAKGPLNVVGNIKTNAPVASKDGSITVKTSTGGININPGVQVTANGGNIVVSADSLTGTINVGSGAKFVASSTTAGVGNVTFNTGLSTSKEIGPNPGNVQVTESGGGKVYFSKSSITANSPDNTLNAEGRDIIFSGDKVTSITLGGGVSVKADPPANQQ